MAGAAWCADACIRFLVVPLMARLQHLGVSGSLEIRRETILNLKKSDSVVLSVV